MPAPRFGHHKQRSWSTIASLIVLVALLAMAVVLFIMNQNISKVTLPPDIKTKLTFPAYLPEKLPGSYRLQANSFSFQEDAVLLFKAVDSSGSNLLFSEQAKPKEMNFEDFYAKQMKEAKTLSGTPYASVWGRTADESSSILSIVTDETWILLTTKTPISEPDLQTIAKNLQRR